MKEAEKKHEQIISSALNVTSWRIIAASGFEVENSSYVKIRLENMYVIRL